MVFRSTSHDDIATRQHDEVPDTVFRLFQDSYGQVLFVDLGLNVDCRKIRDRKQLRTAVHNLPGRKT